MMNIFRADIYRILRGKAIYITFAVLLLMNVLMVVTSEPASIGITIGEEEDPAVYEQTESLIFNGLNIAEVLYTSAVNLAYFLLPLFAVAATPMFSHGTVKNGLSCGMSRTKLYFSKLLLCSVLSLLMVLIYMSSGILIATILRGYGGTPPGGYWLNIVKTCSAQLFLLLALNSVGVFLTFTSKRTSIVIGTYIAFCLVPTIIIVALMNISQDFIKMLDYDLLSNIEKLGYMEALTTPDFVKAFATGAFYIIVPTIAGITLFKRAEIK